MIYNIKTIFQQFSQDKNFRVGIISSVGDFFTAGIDLNFIQSLYPSDVEDIGRKSMILRSVITGLQECFIPLAKCQKPIISVVHGGCVGLGCDLISCTDIRYCTEKTFFQVKEVELGLAADMGSLQFLPLIMSNQSFVREIVLSGRQFSSNEAMQFGLVSKVFSDSDRAFQEALNLAKLIASRSPIAVQGSKINLDYSRDNGVWNGLNHVATWNMAMLQSEDLPKSAMAIVTKSEESPKFEDI